MATLSGIYLDQGTTGVTIDNNTIAHSIWDGTFLNNNSGNIISNNTVYDVKYGVEIHQDYKGLLRNNIISGNKFVAVSNSQYPLYVNSEENDNLSLLAQFNNNYYTRPIKDSLTIQLNNPSRSYYTLAQWQSLVNGDEGSKRSPIRITDTSHIIFNYNADSVSKTISFPFNCIDLNGSTY